MGQGAGGRAGRNEKLEELTLETGFEMSLAARFSPISCPSLQYLTRTLPNGTLRCPGTKLGFMPCEPQLRL